MKRRWFTALAAGALLLFGIVVSWGVAGYITPLEVATRPSGDARERIVRCVKGKIIVANLRWRESDRAKEERHWPRERVLTWPENAEIRGLPAELGFHRDRRTFSPGNVFYNAGLQGVTVVQAPLWPLALVTGALPA